MPNSLKTSGKKAGLLTVLSISPVETDHASLESIMAHSRWMMFKAGDLSAASSLLRAHAISVVLCERHLGMEKWTDVLEHIRALAVPPSLIVTSRTADERLWAEALNLGAWDVLPKPFEGTEVLRTVKAAWQNWHDRSHTPRYAQAVMNAAG